MDCSNETPVTTGSPIDRIYKPQELVMQNPLILRKIFTFFNIETLKSCRNVSSYWNYLSLPSLLNRSWVTIMSDEGHLNDLSEFLAFAELASENFVLHNYRLKFMTLTESKNEETKIIQFFEKHGSSIIRLHLRRGIFNQHGDFWKMLVNNSKWTPNLKELFLEECCFMKFENGLSQNSPSNNRITSLILQSDRTDFSMPCHMSELFTQFPYLETLHFLDLSDEENQAWLESAVPTKAKTAKRHLNITNLDLFSEREYSVRELPLSQLRMLCAMELPLTKLTIDIGENMHLSEFERLLQVYANSLKSLTIWRGLLANKIEPPGFPFSVNLPKLEYLEIPESIIISFNFIHKICQIRSLVVRQCDLNPIPYETDIFSYLYTFDDMRAFVLKPLLDLSELHVQFTLRENDVKFLKGIFPKMRMLSGFFERVYVQKLF